MFFLFKSLKVAKTRHQNKHGSLNKDHKHRKSSKIILVQRKTQRKKKQDFLIRKGKRALRLESVDKIYSLSKKQLI